MKITNTLINSTLSLLLVLSAVGVVSGFSTGSGSCFGGGSAAVGGPHLSTDNGRNVTAGTLSDFGITLLLNGVAMDPSNGQASLERDVSYTVEVTAPANTMRGCFIRFQGSLTIPKEDNFILNSDGATTNVSGLCDDFDTVLGLSHVNADFKEVCGGELILLDNNSTRDAGSEVILIEITAVVANKEASIYAYNEFRTLVEQASTVDPSLPDVASPDPSDSVPPTVGEGTESPSDPGSDLGSNPSPSIPSPVPPPSALAPAPAAPTPDRGGQPTEAPINSAAATAIAHCRTVLGSIFIALITTILI